MQHLLGDKLGMSADANTFFRKLFLQRLPPNVRIVLVSADALMDIKKLADMADKVMEVAMTTVSPIADNRTDTSEVTQLWEVFTCLADLVTSLTMRSQQVTVHTPPSALPCPTKLCSCAGTMLSLAKLQERSKPVLNAWCNHFTI